MAESQEEVKSLLMYVKEESEAGLKLNIEKNEDHGMWSNHFMSNKWEDNGKSERFYLLGSKNHCSYDYSHQIKGHFPLGRKAVTNLNILKSSDINLLTKVHIFKAIDFPVVTHRCESWTIKKAEHQRIDAFELWSWKRLLKVPWCRGPAPADPGNSKWGRRRRGSGNNCLTKRLLRI